jgi:diadenosine tetraphosphate (Ap4A) HIT family hydrolase
VTANSPSESCLICDLEHAEQRTVVFRDELWAAEMVDGYDVPGWFFLRTRRHAERITGLADAELDSLGHRARDLVAAVAESTGAAAVYLFVFGENYPHFHAVVTPRGDQVPENRRSGDILKLRHERADAGAALRLVPAVRAAYERIVHDRVSRSRIVRDGTLTST